MAPGILLTDKGLFGVGGHGMAGQRALPYLVVVFVVSVWALVAWVVMLNCLRFCAAPMRVLSLGWELTSIMGHQVATMAAS